MSEGTRQVLLFLGTAVMAALVLLPLFLVLKFLLDAGLEVLLISVVAVGLLVGYVLRRETNR
jgi:hypothetical protein